MEAYSPLAVARETARGGEIIDRCDPYVEGAISWREPRQKAAVRAHSRLCAAWIAEKFAAWNERRLVQQTILRQLQQPTSVARVAPLFAAGRGRLSGRRCDCG